jgi:hypothetical protein
MIELQRIRPNGDIAQAPLLVRRDVPEAGQDADAVARIRRDLQDRGLVLTVLLCPPVQQAARYRDPRAYQAYIEEMACLP